MNKKKPIDDELTLEQIKRLVVKAVYSDDQLIEHLVLKGGNALDLVYKIGARASVDVDFSMADDFPGQADGLRARLDSTLRATFQPSGLVPFDLKVEHKPHEVSQDLKAFWGGYLATFKLIAVDAYERLRGELEGLRREAIRLGRSSNFEIEISKHEFVQPRIEREFEDVSVFVYSPEMIVAEKLRALCQQMREYGDVVRRGNERNGGRARDLVDIHSVVEKLQVKTSGDEFKALVADVFEAKRVPLALLRRLPNYVEIHRTDFPSVQGTLYADFKLQPFDFYWEFVLNIVRTLEPLGDEQTPA